jgi:hypothetical protein
VCSTGAPRFEGRRVWCGVFGCGDRQLGLEFWRGGFVNTRNAGRAGRIGKLKCWSVHIMLKARKTPMHLTTTNVTVWAFLDAFSRFRYQSVIAATLLYRSGEFISNTSVVVNRGREGYLARA